MFTQTASRRGIMIRSWAGCDGLYQMKMVGMTNSFVGYIETIWERIAYDIEKSVKKYGACANIDIIMCESGCDTEKWVPIRRCSLI